MTNIITFIYRDFWEFKNKPIKFLAVLISMIFPVLGGWSDNGMLADRQNLVVLMVLIVPIYLSMETTLSQTSNYIREGIFEQYFLNDKIRKTQIVIAKWVFNSVLSLISCACSWLVYQILNKSGVLTTVFNLTPMLMLDVIIVSYVSSVIGIIAATLIKNEKAHFIYAMCMIFILLIVFTVFDRYKLFSEGILFAYLAGISAVGTLLIQVMYKSNRFINRDR